MNHKTIFTLTLVLIAALGIGVLRATSQTEGIPPERAPQATVGTAFTYQGHLNDGGSPANGSYDFQFSLYDAASDGTQIGSTVTVSALAVSNGLFTTSLDFGSGAFNGDARYLAISVASAGTGNYTELLPRQELLAAPVALSLQPNIPINPSSIDIQNGDVHVNGDISVSESGTYGVSVYDATKHGLLVNGTGLDGIHVVNPGQRAAYLDGDVRVNGNLSISDSGTYGVSAYNATKHGLLVNGTGLDGIHVVNPGQRAAYLDGDVLVNGTTTTDILAITGGADLSEWFDVREGEMEVAPGMVVCIDPENEGALVVCTSEYAKTVAGAISGAGGVNTGMTMGQDGSIADGDYPVALTGRIYVWADASYGTIEPGDLLTTSNTVGHVMLASDDTRTGGTLIGKAMSTLDSGTGLILVLINLQ